MQESSRKHFSVIVGKTNSIELLLVALLADGHVLIEDIPGLGKTLIAKSLARSIGGSFQKGPIYPGPPAGRYYRLQCLQSADRAVYLPAGPVMTNVLLADEINRTIPRTQSSLLESMEERQVTVDGTTYPLPHPFFVMATQNPIELEGTFPLPEAQLDRFLLSVRLGYPDKDEEIAILERFQQGGPLARVRSGGQSRAGCGAAGAPEKNSHFPPRPGIHHGYRERDPQHVLLASRGESRGVLSGLMRAGQALAALRGREYVLPDDIKSLAVPVLAHRLILRGRRAAAGRNPGVAVWKSILRQIPCLLLR